MPPRRKRRGLELGLLLLMNELLQFGMKNIPPITLGTILGQTLLYMGIINVPWDKEEVCISGNSILKDKDWRRLVLSAIEHGDDMHLYFNMASFLMKGRSLERRYGSKNFLIILSFLLLVTSTMYVTLAQVMTNIMETENYMDSCAIGFSGVIFALKVLTTYEEPHIRAMLLGIEIPGKYAAWIELIVIHLLVPNSSFMGHFAGVLAGIMYCKTYVGSIVDILAECFTGEPVVHNGTVFYFLTPCGETALVSKPQNKEREDFERVSSREWDTTLYDNNEDFEGISSPEWDATLFDNSDCSDTEYENYGPSDEY